MIFHNRYSTSGDWHEHLNNQPLFREGVSLAFNGTLDMRSKQQMEVAYGVKLHTSNDGELPLIAYLDGGVEGLRSFIAQSKGSFAGILITKNKIIALRNAKRPLWLHSGSSLVIASTEDILKRAGLTSHNEQLEHGKVYEWTI
jgi:glutamine phosphoribosylpyrophosphate amidotransferase